MRKEKRSTTSAGMVQLPLRVAILVSLVGVGGALVKTRAVAQTTSSLVWTRAETARLYGVNKHLNDLEVTDRQLLPVGPPLVLVGTLSQRVQDVRTPLPGAYIDRWHCNASSISSDESSQDPGSTSTINHEKRAWH